jgi:hypothetical protein
VGQTSIRDSTTPSQIEVLQR